MFFVFLGVIVAAVAVWLCGLRPLSRLLDRAHTTIVETRPVDSLVYEDGALVLAGVKLYLMAPAAQWSGVVADISGSGRGRLKLAGLTFPLGPGAGALSAQTGAPRFTSQPDAGDSVRFTIERSLLSWPTPLETNWMTGVTASRRRSLYGRLRWTKRSGAKLEMMWRIEQGYYRDGGWRPATIDTLTANLDRTSIVEARDLIDSCARYLREKKHWDRTEYQLEDSGPSKGVNEERFLALHRRDESAAAPGTSRSVELLVDYRTRQVTREIGGQ